MTTASARQSAAVTAVFFVNGATFSSWLPRLPEVRDRLGIGLDEVGVILLCIGLGGLFASALAGRVVDAVGSRAACVVAAAGLSALLPMVAFVTGPVALGLVLLVLGSLDAVADISMNVQAAQVQGSRDRSVVQRFHAVWSVGVVCGSGLAAASAALALSMRAQLTVTGAVLVATVGASARWLSDVDDKPVPTASGDRARRSTVGLLALTALAVAVVEGAPGDWAALFGHDVHAASSGVAAVGSMAVAVGMVIGRLVGDRLTDRVGGSALFRRALVVVAVGLLVVISSPDLVVAVAGLGLTGVGVSVLFPTLYLRAARTPGVPSGLGIGVMSAGGRLGFLLSPAVVGQVAAASSLRVALGSVVGSALATAWLLDRVVSRAARRVP